MRTHLLLITSRVLVPLFLAGCQEAPTDSQDGRTASQTSVSPMMSSSSSAPAAGKPVLHFVANGDNGYVVWSTAPDALGNSVFGVVSIDQLVDPEFDNFYYTVTQCDVFFNCTELESGFGSSPAAILTRSGGGAKIKGLKLSINTSSPDFCCRSSGEGGLISVEWVRTPGFEEQSSGHTDFTVGTITEHSHGARTLYSATATGTMVGFPIPSSQYAFLGSSQNRVVEIVHRDKSQAP